ncbi:hypothetical protein C8R44DRAFT_889132 [Mycena epipterygia]|nr:hypothetical protein C8R44DRAFT_889132 [Mycena epipterygia]
MNVEEFGKILRAVSGPVVQRLAITVAPDKSRWIAPDLEEFLKGILENKDSDIAFFARFTSLHELDLPFDGATPALMDILLALLPHAPMLGHLTFDLPENRPSIGLAEAAAKYLGVIPTLASVSWRNELSFHAVGRGGDYQIVERPYLVPLWHQCSGIGEWWELEPQTNGDTNSE